MQKRSGSVGRVTPPKSAEILVSTPEAMKKVKGFVDDRHPEKKLMFDRYGRMVLHDMKLAEDIRAQYGAAKYGGDGSVTVVPVESTKGRSRRKVFAIRVPWKE